MPLAKLIALAALPLLTAQSAGPPAAAPSTDSASVEPATLAPGWKPPQPVDDGCIGGRLQKSGPARASVDSTFVARFSVALSGEVEHLAVERETTEQALPSEEEGRIRARVEKALRSCRWSPAVDPDGRPRAVWLTQPVHFPGPPSAERPTEVEPGCVTRRLRALLNRRGFGGLTVVVPVEVDGSIGPIKLPSLHETSPEAEMAVKGAVMLCQFKPGLDKDGKPMAASLVFNVVFVTPR